tara:strand:- start:232 stop:717 length:486 start_codon:yes stop_codon:yes gene_type:complete
MIEDDEDAIFKQASKEWDAGKTKQAYKLFAQAAEQGDLSSLHNLAYFYDVGIGVTKNEKKALRLYKHAVRQGNVTSMCNIGTIYRDWGNFRRARFWFLKAFENGDGDAALELAKMYLKRNARGDSKRASKYLKLAISAKSVTEASVEEAELLLSNLTTSEN